jgi:hypothetical protein
LRKYEKMSDTQTSQAPHRIAKSPAAEPPTLPDFSMSRFGQAWV